jgi:hypothetical protein
MFQSKEIHKIEQTFCVEYLAFENPAFYEIMWKNIVQPGRPQMTIRRLHIACWIPKATNTHPEYLILIADPL